MRIIAGSRGGRRLKSPAGFTVRPTPDRVREALFSILGERVEGARFLDLYAGTGAVGLEALSRGARFAHFVEQSERALRVIRQNVERLEYPDQCLLWSGRLPAVLGKLADTQPPFDLIFADPPYERGHPERLVNSPATVGLAAPGALFVIELRESEHPEPGLWRPLERRRYGDTSLLFLTLDTEEN